MKEINKHLNVSVLLSMFISMSYLWHNNKENGNTSWPIYNFNQETPVLKE